jgi:hypothetical protein
MLGREHPLEKEGDNMRREPVKKAYDEAKRFIALAQELLNEDSAVKAREAKRKEEDRYGWEHSPLTGSKLSGSTRRASLDLTRALAEMRKP